MTELLPSSQSLDVQPICAPEPTVRPSADAFRAVYDAHFDYVWHSLRRLGVPDRDLEDLCHDAFVALFRAEERYDPARPLRPWLFGIAFRIASDYRRRASNRFEIPTEPYEVGDTSPGADEQIALEQRRQIVLEALSTLDLDRRAVLVMHDLDGFSMPEIAAVLDAPLNTLYSRLRLARADFSAAVRRRHLRGLP